MGGILYYCPATKLQEDNVSVRGPHVITTHDTIGQRQIMWGTPPHPTLALVSTPALPRPHGDFTIQGPPPQNPDT